MNGYTPSIPVREQIKNLYAQVTDDQFLAALAHADNGNPHDFVRFLVGEALHPADAAYELEKTMDEGFEDDWCDNGLFDDRPYRPATSDGDLPF